MATLHIHLDESGNFEFSPKGTRFFIFTAVWTYNPAPLAEQLSKLRHRLIKDGLFRPGKIDDLSGFHACDDPAPRRRAFIEVATGFKEWEFASIVVEKNRLNRVLYEPEKFYPKFLNHVLNFVLRGNVRPGTNQILVYTDTLPMKSRKESAVVNQQITIACKQSVPAIRTHIMHHSGESNYWIQVADYCSWAVNRKWEHQDVSAYDQLRPRLARPEIAPMSRGDGSTYY